MPNLEGLNRIYSKFYED